jgi:2,3-diketo-5-methylthiopentyl-1-phosphate enolase
MNRFYSTVVNPLVEGVNLDDYVVATYLVGAEAHEDPLVKAVSIAIEQTTGSWADVAAETDEFRAKYAGKVFGVYEVPDYVNATDLKMGLAEGQLRFYIIRIGYPVVNIDDNIPLLFSTITGNITALPNLKCVDIDFPESFVKKFKGPKFGLEGIRKLLGVYDRPLLNNMIKPCTGYTPQVGAELFFEAAVGGIDHIKDDELIGGDRAFNNLEERVTRNMEMAAKAEQIKGEKTLYTVNITDEVSRLKDNAMRAIKAGANGLMIDGWSTGLSALRSLAEDPDINVPILSHPSYTGAVYASPYQGVSTTVVNKLTRLCGADIVVIPHPIGKFDQMKFKSIQSYIQCTSKMYHIKPCAVLWGGGTIAGNIPYMMNETGNDCIMGAGAAVHGFPDGPRAGAKALRQAIEAGMKNQSLREAAKEHEELRKALDKWGVVGEEDIKKNYLI